MSEQDSDKSIGPGVLSVSSPLPFIFAEQKHGDYQAREALFTTFNADLGYFERTVLGTVQATGARTSVIADASVWAPDARAARNAGSRYLPGMAAHPAGSAFHPKVSVIVGPERALVAVGSGNLSSGGWHLNRETWTIAAADATGCPPMIPEIASWLRGLNAVVTLSPGAAEGLARTAEGLEALASSAPRLKEGPRIVHTNTRPIIDQLPEGPAAELFLYAPFHDPNAHAFRALVTRYAPQKVHLAVQGDGRTIIQPDAIARAVHELSKRMSFVFEVTEDSAPRYRHGKLVEALMPDGRRWSLTGSPNLSKRALLQAVSSGGNVEVGVVAFHSESLFPPGNRIELSAVPAKSISNDDDDEQGSCPLILGATQKVDGLLVDFVRPVPFSLALEVSSDNQFDRWVKLVEIALGTSTTLIDHQARGADRLRCTWTDINGQARKGPAHFVVDPERIRLRATDLAISGRRRVTNPIALIGDSRIAELWFSNLSQLAAAQGAIVLPSVAGPNAPLPEKGLGEPSKPGRYLPDDEHSWLTYQDDAKTRLGSAVFAFALGGFPKLLSSTLDLGLDVPTDQLVDERTAALDDDDAELVNEDTDPAETRGEDLTESQRPEDDRSLANETSEYDKRRIRKFIRRAVTVDAPRLAAIDRLAIAILTLCSVQSNVWPSPDGTNGWASIVESAITNLEHFDANGVSDIPERIVENVGSVAAVACYLLHEVSVDLHDPLARNRFDQAVDAVSHLLPASTTDAISAYVAPMHNSRGFPIDAEDVERVAAMIVQDDPIVDAIDRIETAHPEWTAHAHGAREIHVLAPDVRDPFRVAADVLDGVSKSQGPFAIQATVRGDESCLLVRSGKDVLLYDTPKSRPRWQHFRPTELITAKTVAHIPEAATRIRIQNFPSDKPFTEAEHILKAVGRDLPIDLNVECAD
jgi:hypothetical protein